MRESKAKRDNPKEPSFDLEIVHESGSISPHLGPNKHSCWTGKLRYHVGTFPSFPRLPKINQLRACALPIVPFPTAEGEREGTWETILCGQKRRRNAVWYCTPHERAQFAAMMESTVWHGKGLGSQYYSVAPAYCKNRALWITVRFSGQPLCNLISLFAFFSTHVARNSFNATSFC